MPCSSNRWPHSPRLARTRKPRSCSILCRSYHYTISVHCKKLQEVLHKIHRLTKNRTLFRVDASSGRIASLQDLLRSSRLTCPPQSPTNNSSCGFRGQRDRFILSTVRNQGICMSDLDQSRNDQSLLSVCRHNNQLHQFVLFGTPFNGRCPHRFRLHLPWIDNLVPATREGGLS